MRFLRVSLASLMILLLIGGTALAAETTESTTESTAESTAESTTETSTETSTGTTDETSTETTDETSTETTEETATEPSVTDEVYGVTDAVYELKLSGTVVAITPPDGDTPGSITLLIGGKEVTISFPADAVEDGEPIEVGSYIELKGTTEAVEKIEVSEADEESETEVKTAVAGVTAGAEGEGATITLMIAGQPVTFTAEELGIPAEAVSLITVGAEFKLETNQDGETEMKISSELGTVKVEVDEDGTVEVKVETGEKKGKGHEIAEEKKAEAEAKKEAAKKKAEEAKEKAKAKKEAAKAKGKGKGKK
ncbi:MAG: hypothetical protein ACOY93_17460 [Bacillota bacterium]